jgi:hypothetical protein
MVEGLVGRKSKFLEAKDDAGELKGMIKSFSSLQMKV